MQANAVPTAVTTALQQGKVPTSPTPLSPVARVPPSTSWAGQADMMTAEARIRKRDRRVLDKAVEDAQAQTQPNHAYFTVVQRGKFTPALRRNVVTWMQRCALHFQLLPETLEIAIHMFDRFLSVVYVPGDKHVRVVGVTCVFLATKLSESMEDGPALRDVVMASGAAFSVNDIMRMERIILNKLTWSVGNTVTSGMVAELMLNVLSQLEEDALTPQQHTRMLEHVRTTLYTVQTSTCLMRFNPTEVAAAAVIGAAVQTAPAPVDTKKVYAVICGLTNTDAAIVSECSDVLAPATTHLAPL